MCGYISSVVVSKAKCLFRRILDCLIDYCLSAQRPKRKGPRKTRKDKNYVEDLKERIERAYNGHLGKRSISN